MRIEDERPYEDKKRTDKPFILRFVYICRIMSNIIHNYQFLYNVNIIFIFHLINVHERRCRTIIGLYSISVCRETSGDVKSKVLVELFQKLAGS